MTMSMFHRRLAELARDAMSKRPISTVLKDYSALEARAIREGVKTLKLIDMRRWIAEQSLIVTQLRLAPFSLVASMMLRALALGFSSPFRKYVSIGLFSDYCRQIGAHGIANQCLRAAVADVESDPRSKTEWKSYLESTALNASKREKSVSDRLGKKEKLGWDEMLSQDSRERRRKSAVEKTRSRRLK